MRRAFVEALTDLARKDPAVVFLTGDLGFQVFDDFKARFGPRYINVGIAEAELACAGAGLAREGFRPFVYSIASFMTGRAYELLRIAVAYPRLPVVVVGAGGGYCYSTTGVTHHSPDDVGLMSLLPGMTVTVPGDPTEVRALLPQLAALPGPSYIRIGKFGEPSYESPAPVTLGRARLLRRGEKVAILSFGEMASVALEAAKSLEAEGMRPWVHQFHTLKPIDTGALEEISAEAHTLVIVEETSPMGGLHRAVTERLCGSARRPTLIRLGPPDELALGSPRRETLRRRWGFDAEATAQACRRAWKAV
ncbi:MAG: transketolase C-terminal domain-containing protein [Elusimicrobiota bacterium]